MKASFRPLALVLCLVGLGAPAVADEAPKPDASLEISAKALAAAVGFTWGRGTLEFQGTIHEVTLSGINVIAVGFTSVTAKGGVYHLTKLEDFDGDYVALPRGATVGEGGAGVAMRNEKGVEVRLVATNQGVTLSLGASKVMLAIQK
jgi:hypothetical protein